MKDINTLIHQPVRLQIMSLLHLDKSMTFSDLKKELQLSDGNLGSHLEKLEKAGYIQIHKKFVGKKPQSTIHILSLGESELIKYMNTIEKLFKSINN